MGTLRNLLAFWKPKSELYVFGSSILWGQGHLSGDKIHVKVANWLEEEGGERVTIIQRAHSGALLLASAEPEPERLHGEVPTPWPSIEKQIRTAPAPKSKRVRVLVEGGINEVGGSTILNPRTPGHAIRKAVESTCLHGLRRVLDRLSRQFPSADIYVLGYYQILADRTADREVEDLLSTEGIENPPEIAPDAMASGAIANCRLFWRESDRCMRQATESVAAGHAGRCVFVESGFAPTEGLFGEESLLFYPWSKDAMLRQRVRHCAVAIGRRRTGAHCFLAATAHPNTRGVDRYVQSILTILRRGQG